MKAIPASFPRKRKSSSLLKDIGEIGLLEQHIFPALARQAPLGDDCGWMELGDGKVLLVSTDSMVQDSDYRKQWMSPEDLAVKSLRTALSDIAAMGGAESLGAVIAMGAEPNSQSKEASDFAQALAREAKKWKCKIAGGDLSGVKGQEFVTVTVFGIAEKAKLLLRSQARPGETLWLTGPLGLARAGLEVLEAGQASRQPRLAQAHLRPALLLKEGSKIAVRNISRCAIDTSDSLAASLWWIAKLSHVNLRVNLRQFPVTKEVALWAEERRRPLADYLLYGGEDYQLLFTSTTSRRIMSRHLPLAYPIGQVLPGPAGVVIEDLSGQERRLSDHDIGQQAFS